MRKNPFSSPDAFVRNFLETLTPGAIPRSNFIGWKTVAERLKTLREPLEFCEALRAHSKSRADFVAEFSDALLAADVPLPYLECAFELLGHTDEEYASDRDDFSVKSASQKIAAGDEAAARGAAELLWDLGIAHVLTRESPADVMLGVQVGLETHVRKNKGGEAFSGLLAFALEEALRAVPELELTLAREVRIPYGSAGKRLEKRADFCLMRAGKPLVAIEANFYTSTGSKPTEIKRTYGALSTGLLAEGVELLWVTDGKGYRKMEKSLRDAYVIFPSIYNYRQLRAHLAEDLRHRYGGRPGKVPINR